MPSRPTFDNACLADALTNGFALNAIPSPAIANIGKSLAATGSPCVGFSVSSRIGAVKAPLYFG